MSNQILHSMVGRAESIHDGNAFVILKTLGDDQLIEAQCKSSLLISAGISSGDEFRCDVVRSGKGVGVIFTKLEPREIPTQRVMEIFNEFERRWNFN